MKKIVLLFALAALCISIAHRDSARAISEGGQSSSCLECHTKQSPDVVALYHSSTHAQAGISCSRCHGGNPSAAHKQLAHAGRFVGKPSPGEVVSMCGSCHASERTAFRTSLHFEAERNAPKVDCTQCHGAHAVGSIDRSFKVAEVCSNCHGLEYIQALPGEFQKIIVSVDEQIETLRSLKLQSRKASDDLTRQRRQTRHMVGEIVHATDLRSGLEKAPQIFEMTEQFRRARRQ